MNLSYEAVKDGVRINQIANVSTVAVIPESLGGLPVTELGAYALSGSDVEELHLPSQLRKIGAYAFYNCENLRRIYAYGRALDLGAGLFAGAGGIEFLDITLFDQEKSCLKELLSELRQTLRVRIHQRQGHEARLIFPEYFEESVENTPARILFIETHGCGHRYRYCFSQFQFQYSQYDELFPHVKVQEPESLVTELALGRLQYPLELSAKHKQMYREYVAEHWKTAGHLLIRANRRSLQEVSNLEPGGIPWLIKEILQPQYTLPEISNPPLKKTSSFKEDLFLPLRELTRMAQEARDTETVSWLMNYQHNLHFHNSSRICDNLAYDKVQEGNLRQTNSRRRFVL